MWPQHLEQEAEPDNGEQQELMEHWVEFHAEAPYVKSQTRAILPDVQVTELSVRYRYTTAHSLTRCMPCFVDLFSMVLFYRSSGLLLEI